MARYAQNKEFFKRLVKMIVNIIGYMAAILTTFSFVPQAIKIIQTRDTKSISLKMYVMFTTGVFCWLIYGILNNLIQIIIANFITLILSALILGMKLKNLKQDRESD